MVNFGNKLKQLRTQSGLTQQQLAEKIGVTKSVISYYELQERYPSPDILIRLANAFHTSTDYLLDLDEKKAIYISGLSDEEISAIHTFIDLLKNKEQKR